MVDAKLMIPVPVTTPKSMPPADIVNAPVNDPYGSKLVMRPKKTMADIKASGVQKPAEIKAFGVIGAGQIGNGSSQFMPYAGGLPVNGPVRQRARLCVPIDSLCGPDQDLFFHPGF
jgi:hypothetical protein